MGFCEDHFETQECWNLVGILPEQVVLKQRKDVVYPLDIVIGYCSLKALSIHEDCQGGKWRSSVNFWWVRFGECLAKARKMNDCVRKKKYRNLDFAGFLHSLSDSTTQIRVQKICLRALEKFWESSVVHVYLSFCERCQHFICSFIYIHWFVKFLLMYKLCIEVHICSSINCTYTFISFFFPTNAYWLTLRANKRVFALRTLYCS